MKIFIREKLNLALVQQLPRWEYHSDIIVNTIGNIHLETVMWLYFAYIPPYVHGNVTYQRCDKTTCYL